VVVALARLSVLVVLPALLASCVPDLPFSVPKQDGSSDDSKSPSSGDGTSDGKAPNDAGDGQSPPDSDASSPNLLLNPGFEKASCTSWDSGVATVSPSEIHREGRQSCRVCSEANQSVYMLFQRLPVSKFTPAVTYVGSAYVRADPSHDAAAAGLHFALELDTGETPLVFNEDPIPETLDTEWRYVSNELTYEPADGGLYIFFGLVNRGVDNGCFLVDDAKLVPKL
jgi:hypothetical protein